MIRVTLAPSVTRGDFHTFAARARWDLHRVVEPGPENPYEEVWTIRQETSAAHYIEDYLIGTAYVLAIGAEEDSVAGELREGLDTVSPEQALEWVRSGGTKDERLQAVSYLGSATPPSVHPSVLDGFALALADGDPDVRQHAIFATSYATWAELDDLLERVRADDPDPRLRAAAEKALTVRRHRDGEGS